MLEGLGYPIAGSSVTNQFLSLQRSVDHDLSFAKKLGYTFDQDAKELINYGVILTPEQREENQQLARGSFTLDTLDKFESGFSGLATPDLIAKEDGVLFERFVDKHYSFTPKEFEALELYRTHPEQIHDANEYQEVLDTFKADQRLKTRHGSTPSLSILEGSLADAGVDLNANVIILQDNEKKTISVRDLTKSIHESSFNPQRRLDFRTLEFIGPPRPSQHVLTDKNNPILNLQGQWEPEQYNFKTGENNLQEGSKLSKALGASFTYEYETITPEYTPDKPRLQAPYLLLPAPVRKLIVGTKPYVDSLLSDIPDTGSGALAHDIHSNFYNTLTSLGIAEKEVASFGLELASSLPTMFIGERSTSLASIHPETAKVYSQLETNTLDFFKNTTPRKIVDLAPTDVSIVPSAIDDISKGYVPTGTGLGVIPDTITLGAEIAISVPGGGVRQLKNIKNLRNVNWETITNLKKKPIQYVRDNLPIKIVKKTEAPNVKLIGETATGKLGLDYGTVIPKPITKFKPANPLPVLPLTKHANKVREGFRSRQAVNQNWSVLNDIIAKRGNANPFKKPLTTSKPPVPIKSRYPDGEKLFGTKATTPVKPKPFTQDGTHNISRKEILDHGNKVREGSTSLDAMRTTSTLLDDIIAKYGSGNPFKKPLANPKSISNKLPDEPIYKKPTGGIATGKLGVDYGKVIPRSAIKPKPVNNSFTQDGPSWFPS